MHIKTLIISLSLGMLSIPGLPQELVQDSIQSSRTLEEAIALALENNFDIQLERYEVAQSQNNVSPALSGQRPRVEINASYEWGHANAEVQALGFGAQEGAPRPLELEGTSNDLSLRPQISVPIFEGFKGKYRYKQLENAHQMSQLQLTGVIEQTLVNTVSAYLEAARLQAQMAISQDNIAISSDRWQRVSEDAKFGVANSVRRLQAEVDLKTDSANYRNTRLAYENSLRNLNLIIGQPLEDTYTVQEEIVLSEDLQWDALLGDMRVYNTQLKLSQKTIDQAAYDVKIAEAGFFPSLRGYANYSYLNVEDEASFLQSNTVYGPNVGLTLQYALFTGGTNKIQRQNAKISLDQQKTAQQQTELTLEKELRNAYAQYRNNQAQLRTEESNLATFERNYEKVHEDYALGLLSTSDLRTAQLNLTAAKNRINNLIYSVKQSEIRLLHLSGKLRPSE